VANTAKYPAYISLTISALANDYTRDAVVTWKQRSTLDTDFSFDKEYDFFDKQGYNITLSLDREMSVLQALEVIGQHGDCFLFTDNWGVEKIHTFRPHYFASMPAVTGSTNLLPGVRLSTKELVNEIIVRYGYDHQNSEFLYEYKFPESADTNKSYIRNGFIRSRTIELLGVWTEKYAKYIAMRKYWMFQNGLTFVEFMTDLQGLLLTIGDRIDFDSEYPDIEKSLEICGMLGVELLNKFDIKLLAYDATGWENCFLINDSGIATGRTLW
jgi:hypothetical protein